MIHLLTSETGILVSRLLSLQALSNGLHVCVRGVGLSAEEDIHEPTGQIFEDVPQMPHRLFGRKTAPASLSQKAKQELGLLERRV